MSAYKSKNATLKIKSLDDRPEFINNLDKYSSKTEAQKMLEQIEKMKKQRNVAKKSTLNVTYDTHAGKYVKTENEAKMQISNENKLFQKQIEHTQLDVAQNRKYYTQTVASALLDELQTEFQRSQLIDDLFDKNQQEQVQLQFNQEREEFQDFIKQTREDFDTFQKVKETHLDLLVVGSQKRDKEDKSLKKEQASKLAHIQYEMEEALKKSQEAIRQRAQHQKEVKQRLKVQ